MFIWGKGSETAWACEFEHWECSNCGTLRPFSVYLTYSYAHLFEIFSWVTKQEYCVACEICRSASAISLEEVKELAPVDPVPVLRRYGWMIGAGLLAIIFGIFTTIP